jgi:hypothetical protein
MGSKKTQMVIYVDFHLGKIVYLKTDPEQLARIITEIRICATREIMYQVSCGSSYGIHHGVEITAIKNETVGVF